MARTVIPIQLSARDTPYLIGTVAAPLLGGTAIDAVNGHYVQSQGHEDRVVILVYNSKAGTITLTIAAGINPPAVDAWRGPVTAAIPTLSFALVPGLNETRHYQTAGQIYIDFDAGATGTIWAYRLAA